MEQENIRVLIVEDDPADMRLAKQALNETALAHFDVSCTDRLSGAVERLRSDRFDALLLDLNLPDSDGLDALQTVRQENGGIPIVVLTGMLDETAAMGALEHGAQDYVIKGNSSAATLNRSVRYAIHRQRLLQELTDAKLLLEKKNKRLAELYEAAQQFVDNASHEFRTPLTVLKEFGSLLREGHAGALSENQVEYIDIMLTRVDDLSFMVDDMLDTSRLEAGLLTVWRTKCEIKDILNHIWPMFERRAAKKGISLEIELAPELPVVYCDAEQIGRVITNLTINAIKFTGAGGRVKLTARHVERPDHIAVEISDTGPGISEDKLGLLFQRFQQVGRNTKSSAKGFGLGLSIAKELVQLNLGSMTVQSTVGQGSSFAFTIPTAVHRELFLHYLDRVASLPDNPFVSLFLGHTQGDPHVSPKVDEFLQSMLRPNDLVCQTGANTWAAIVLCPKDDVNIVKQRFEQQWAEYNRTAACGPLPHLALRHIGTWRVREERAALYAQLCATCTASKVAHGLRPRILLVEDDQDILSAATLRLQAGGFDVLTAVDGPHCISQALETHPDAILLDIRMPGMDGCETLMQLKEFAETQGIPVAMLSASLRDQPRALELGAQMFIQKPYGADTLVSAVHSLINAPMPSEATV